MAALDGLDFVPKDVSTVINTIDKNIIKTVSVEVLANNLTNA